MRSESLAQATGRYRAATHATRSRADRLMTFDGGPRTLGFLRVGTDAVLVSCHALGRQLTEERLITQAQYIGLLADVMEAEGEIYTGALMEHTGSDVAPT